MNFGASSVIFSPGVVFAGYVRVRALFSCVTVFCLMVKAAGLNKYLKSQP